MRYGVRNGSDGTKWLIKPKAAKTAATRTTRGDQTVAMVAVATSRREQWCVVSGSTGPQPRLESIQVSLFYHVLVLSSSSIYVLRRSVGVAAVVARVGRDLK